MRALLRDRRFLLTLLAIVLVAGFFWAGSRVPALTEKASMGGEVNINALGFERVMTASPNDPLWKRIGIEAINWGQTNRKGMAFGVLFGGLMMTLFSLLGTRRYRSVYANAAVGTLIGAPLGVCVNCAAPIAAGMSSAGARIETSLATMMSSPTLNAIVLSMLFSLFPLHLALLKVVLTLGTVLLLVPLLTRHVFTRESSRQEEAVQAACELPLGVLHDDAGESWSTAWRWLARVGARNLWYVFIRTVPLMLVAGLLGAIMITVLPWDTLARPFSTGSVVVILSTMALLALVGTFLPVPMSFDVIVCAVLLAAGMPVKYVAVLLFTLGIFSVYSFFIVWRTISPRAAGVLYANIALLGIVAGLGGHYSDKLLHASEEQLIRDAVAVLSTGAEPILGVMPPELPGDVTRAGATVGPAGGTPDPRSAAPEAAPSPIAFVPAAGASSMGVRLEHRPFAPASSAAERQFSRRDARELGIDLPSTLRFEKGLQPFIMQGVSVASGDVDQDGRPDLLMVRDGSVALFRNDGLRFTRLPLDLGPVAGSTVMNAALQDVNGDGWLDLYIATLGRGAWLVPSVRGAFGVAAPVKLPVGDDALLPAIVAFGDVNHDGSLDLVIGRWEFTPRGIHATARSTALLLLNRGASFDTTALPTPPGAPNSVAISDFSGDGHPDVVLGLDFAPSDYFLLGDGTGRFSAIARTDSVIPATAQNTMSVAIADINNDLRPDIFVAGIARYGDHDEAHPFSTPHKACAEFPHPDEQARCAVDMTDRRIFEVAWQKGGSVRGCARTSTPQRRNECIVWAAIKNGERYEGVDLCNTLPDGWSHMRYLCGAFQRRAPRHAPAWAASEIIQLPEINVLLLAGEDGRFREAAGPMGLAFSGWTWNARFADLNNDGWLDLYANNGWFATEIRQESNFYYRNDRGARFVEETTAVGLETYFATLASTYVDLDGDGDLDVVSVPVYGPVWVFENGLQGAHAVQVELRDGGSANVFGIGAQVTVVAGGDSSLVQRREVQAGSGYLSFDEPVLHFGLGTATEVTRIDVRWGDGTTSTIRGPLPAGARYRVARGAPAASARTAGPIGAMSRSSALP